MALVGSGATANGRQRMKALSIGNASKLVGGLALVAFLVVVATNFIAQRELGVGGPIYNRIVDAKDLTADILPPPLTSSKPISK